MDSAASKMIPIWAWVNTPCCRGALCFKPLSRGIAVMLTEMLRNSKQADQAHEAGHRREALAHEAGHMKEGT